MGARRFTKLEQKQIIIPLADRIAEVHNKGTTIVGLQGGQGTGKTTIVNFLKNELKKRGYKVQSFSIDDFYKSLAERKKLSSNFPENTFYQISRGLPGTHRYKQLLATLKKIKTGKPFKIPFFDKSLHKGRGDITKKTKKVSSKQDIVILEGWCVGIPYVSSENLRKICKKNKINLHKLDPKLKYHLEVLKFVKQYQILWNYLDYMVMLKPSSIKVHQEWRSLQERRLRKSKGGGMNIKEIKGFVEPYLPFTYLCYDKIVPDFKIFIDKKHNYFLSKPKKF